MRKPSGTFALLRVAAGPRIGYGHVRRARVLSDALDARCVLSVRGAAGDAETPAACVEDRPDAVLALVGPRVLIIDDPSTRHAAAWCAAARRLGVPCVSVHDLGLARVPSDLAIDGSVISPATRWPARRLLRGPRYAVLGPILMSRPRRHVARVLLTLGGGPRPALLQAIVAALRRRWPHLEITCPSWAGNQVVGAEQVATAETVGPPRRGGRLALRGLSQAFRDTDAAILGGGVSLYEAVAAGVPSVALAVVKAQRPTVRTFARHRLVRSAGSAEGVAPARVAARVVRELSALIEDHDWRRDVRARGPGLIDGQGVRRVALAVRTLAQGSSRA